MVDVTDHVLARDVDTGVDIALPPRSRRPRRIMLRLAEGTTPIPKLAREYGLSRSAVYSIADRAVKKGLLDRLPGLWPNTYRPGPNMLENALMRHKRLSPENGASRAFTVRSHALQVSLPVVSLDGADMAAWTSWPTKTGTMWKLETGTPRMQLRGRSLVVSVPEISLEATEETIEAAEERIREHVTTYIVLAHKIVHEKYHIVTGSPAHWYRPPHFAIERHPGVPEGVSYTVSFWVDSSLGPAEVESTKIETIESLMAVGNRISRSLSMSTFEA